VTVYSLLPNEMGGRGGEFQHVLVYGILALLLSAWQPLGRTAAAAWGYGAIVEGLQSFVPHRSAELSDLFFNAVGVAAALLLVAARRRFLR
jgi:VanZ family protein